MINLPWPPRSLSPNSRKDRRSATGDRQAYKLVCADAAKKGGYADLKFMHMHLRITFYPPDNRRRDLDNMLGSIKYGLDAIATVTGVDDYFWELTIRRGPATKGGLVSVEIGPPSDKGFVPYRGRAV